MEEMQMLEKFNFIAFSDSGEQLDCEGLFLFDSPETNKTYLVYTDHSLNEDGVENVYASIYDRKAVANLGDLDPNTLVEVDLAPIETEAEWDTVDQMLERYDAAMAEAKNGE